MKRTILDADSGFGRWRKALARRLEADFPRTQFYTSHCTGDQVFAHLKAAMGEQLQTFRCGTIK
ncbi:MAG: hypothetical protein E7070_08090 [Bacteroidales bacterium]|jgi:7,8-dihydropterin-6-yl-methyl-4-(beta-D-ribofuranosyl)aminobenzene 5'-phosphate synthase|nr:hypothetical protein [Bacteroidales bacterium]